MPLLNGNNPLVVSENIKELMRTGKHEHKQAIAIALDHARKSGEHRALGMTHLDAATLHDAKADEAAQHAPNDHETSLDSEMEDGPMQPGETKHIGKDISFKEGGLHASTGTKSGKKIPASKHAAAKSGKLGPKAKKQEVFYENVLKK